MNVMRGHRTGIAGARLHVMARCRFPMMVDFYDDNAERCFEAYNGLDFEAVHADWLDRLPERVVGGDGLSLAR